MPHATKSALQDAREAFIAGLARRADALRPVIENFIADPSAITLRAELQRRLHALLASAQLFEEPALVEQLQRLTSRLDAVSLGSGAWQTPDSDLLLQLLSTLDPSGNRTQHSGVPPAVFGRVSEPVLRGARDLSGRAPAPANETSVRPPAGSGRHENRPPPAPAPPPVVPTHQVGAVMLERVLLVCSRPHAAELRSLLDEAPLELLHAADPEQALTLVERCAPSYALVAAEFATLPDIDLVGRLRQHPHAPVDGVYLMLPNGATYDADFVRQTGADGVLIEPISWEMLGPLLDRPGFETDDSADPNEKLSLDGGLSEAFAQAQSAAKYSHRPVLESGRVPVAKPRPADGAAASVLAHVQAASTQAVDSRAPAAPSGAFESRASAAPSGAFSRGGAAASAPAEPGTPAASGGAVAVDRSSEVEPSEGSDGSAGPEVEAGESAAQSSKSAAQSSESAAQSSESAAQSSESAAQSSESAAPSGGVAAAAQSSEVAAAGQSGGLAAAGQGGGVAAHSLMVPSAVVESRAPAASGGGAAAQSTAAILPSEKPGERTRSLVGRRILVVDDDLAMLWFFSGVVRDAGGEALQARDGADGLDTARRKRPQVVLSDILMPKLDGFGLRRALARDLWLERTPVLLLSWKGDPADNEARAPNASGSLQKTASVPEVLAAIERALAPRKQLEEALRTDGQVTGEVGDLGIVALIECVVSARPDVRLTVEDDADVFDVDIADANQIAVTRTAADGTLTRAERALMQLIGVTQGRFHVRKRSGSLRSPVQTPLKSALHAAVSEISAMIDAVSSERVEHVARLSWDDELLASRLKDTSGFGRIVQGLRALGLSPKQLLLDGVFSSGEISACLTLLARQAVITGLWGSDEQDLLASSTRLYMPRPVPSLPAAARIEPAPAVKAASPAADIAAAPVKPAASFVAPSEPKTGIAEAPTGASAASTSVADAPLSTSVASPPSADAPTGASVTSTSVADAPKGASVVSTSVADAPTGASVASTSVADAPKGASVASPPSADAATGASATSPSVADAPKGASVASPSVADAPEGASVASTSVAAALPSAAGASPSSATATAEPLGDTAESDSPAVEPTPAEIATAKSSEPEPEPDLDPNLEILPPAEKKSAKQSLSAVAAPTPFTDEQEATFESDPEAAFAQEANPELAAEIALARRRRRDGMLLGATLAASAVLGYVGALQLETHPVLFGRDQPIGTRGLETPLMAASPRSETSVRSGLDPSVSLGTVLPYIDTTRGVPVGSDEGLVIFEYVGPLPMPNVEIDGRVLGSPPLSVALAAAPHQLKLWFAGEPTLRTLSVRAGETRVITLPLLKP